MTQAVDTKEGKRIAVLGGCFDPVHLGHLVVAEHAADRLKADTVLFIPCNIPPHKCPERLTPGNHRLRMTELAIRGNPRFKASDIELARGGVSYTIDTVRGLRERYGAEASLFFIVGADSLMEIGMWREAGSILAGCTVAAVGRPGVDLAGWPPEGHPFSPAEPDTLRAGMIETPLIGISSTEIRRRRAARESIRYLVPDAVAKYITEEGLYV